MCISFFFRTLLICGMFFLSYSAFAKESTSRKKQNDNLQRRNYATLHGVAGQLGVQLFQVIQTLTYAWENNLVLAFDKDVFIAAHPPHGELCYKYIFSRLPDYPRDQLDPSEPIHLGHAFREPPGYSGGNVCLCAARTDRWHLGEHRERVCKILGPTDEIIQELRVKYADIIDHPKTVSVHIRTYDPRNYYHMFLGKEYFERAMNYFSDEYVFVIFSDRIAWCKENLKDIKPNMVFIEGNNLVMDLYLMTLCKNSILGNSSYSWMGAYLRGKDEGVVLAPQNWFYGDTCHPLDQPSNPHRNFYLPHWQVVPVDDHREHCWDLLNYPTLSDGEVK